MSIPALGALGSAEVLVKPLPLIRREAGVLNAEVDWKMWPIEGWKPVRDPKSLQHSLEFDSLLHGNAIGADSTAVVAVRPDRERCELLSGVDLALSVLRI